MDPSLQDGALPYVIPDIKIQATVINFDLGITFSDMEELLPIFPNSKYERQKFKALTMDDVYNGHKILLTVYKTGRVIMHGHNVSHLASAARMVVSHLRDNCYCAVLGRFRVCNVVESGCTGFRIRLELLAHRHSKYVSYNNQNFPGLHYRLDSRHGKRASVTIYGNGKFIIRSSISEPGFSRSIMELMMPHLYANRE